jgi:hypothetical protein
MSLYFEVSLSKANVCNILSVCQNFSIFLVGRIANFNEDLVMVYEELNKAERLNN